jgi:hypothetical protein
MLTWRHSGSTPCCARIQISLRVIPLADLTASPEGRAALAARLAEHPAWAVKFYAPRDALTPELLTDRADVVRRMPKAALQCADVAPLVNRMLQANLLDEGQDLWSRACDPEPGLVHDGHFRGLDLDGKGNVTFFNWQLPASGTVELLFDEAANGSRTLDMRVNGGISRSVPRQPTISSPGRYKLSGPCLSKAWLRSPPCAWASAAPPIAARRLRPRPIPRHRDGP